MDIKGPGEVSDIHIRLLEGGIGALMGGSYAGKSKLLHLIAGVDPVGSGRIALGGSDITHMSPAERKALGLGYAFQHPPLFPEIRTDEYVSLGQGGISARSDQLGFLFERLPELEQVWRMQLASLARRARRIADLARVLVAKPKMIMLDELSLDLGVERMIEIVRAPFIVMGRPCWWQNAIPTPCSSLQIRSG